MNISENYNFKRKIFFGFLMLICLALISRIFYLQIIESQKYTSQSKDLSLRIIPSLAPRGNIYERSGRLLATSKPSFGAYLIPQDIKNRKKTINRVSKVLNISASEVEKKLTKKKRQAFEPILIKDNLTKIQITYLEENNLDKEGLVIGITPKRVYPHGKTAAHILGYIGEVDEKETIILKQKGFKGNGYIGKIGLEKVYDDYLRGIDGGQEIEIDILGKPTRILNYYKPIPGQNIYLTIDLDLQKAVEKQLGQKKGAIVCSDPKSGEILAMASYPNFDPNIFARTITPKEWANINRASAPLMNRALTGYPPGSTFKPVTAIAALDSNKASTKSGFFCKGYFTIADRKAACWNTSGHGSIDLIQGIVQSCDVVFYSLGLALGPDIIKKYAIKFGMGNKSSIDLTGESSGLIPTRIWKKKYLKENWYPGDSINIGIGQGFIQTTPLQLNLMMSGIANESYIPKPFINKLIRSPWGTVLLQNSLYIKNHLYIPKSILDIMKNSLELVVEKGTGKSAYLPEIRIAGKTGSAENIPGRKTHAWFSCFAPSDQPSIVITVFLENGGHGGSAAAPLAREIARWWYNNRLKGKNGAQKNN